MIRIIAILILISIAVVIVISYTLDKTELSADEQLQIRGECVSCHSSQNDHETEDSHPGNLNLDCTRCHHDLHHVHANAACIKCHADADALQNADEAHDALQWVGIGATGAVVTGLAVNFAVAKTRLFGSKKDSEKSN